MSDGYLTVAVASALWLLVAAHSPPHVVVILADDLGWNDVGFHGSDQIPTPNIDALAYNGVILNSHYTPALCTPSRAAFMTGKYPIHTGMQHLVILEAQPWGLPLQDRLLPQYLKEVGYHTHAVGKWHLGFHRTEYTPTFRGFDTHFGYYQGFQDYYNHTVKATFEPYEGYDMRRGLATDWSSMGRYSTDLFTEEAFEPYEGYDMRRGLSTDWSSMGRYSTDLFTDEAVRIIADHDSSSPMFLYLSHLAPHAGTGHDPFQAPDEEIAKFAHIQDPERRVYAAMVSRLDQSVGEVVAALRANGMLDNSIIVFMADNGAPTHGIHSNRGSNYPLRGIKESPWEGGVRGVAAIWSPLIRKRQHVSSQLMYITDWLPTIYSAAGRNVSDLGEIDGVDMWHALVHGVESPRTHLVHNIDDIGDVYAALRKGDWKYVKGNVHKGAVDGWYGEVGREPRLQYDVQAVLGSRTAVTIAGYTTKRQISLRRDVQNNYTEGAWTLLSEGAVLSLRQKAEVRCSGSVVECHPRQTACLFNIRDDPCERRDQAAARPDVLADLEELLFRYRRTMVPALNKPSDPLADPMLWNGTWSPWQDPPVVQETGSELLQKALMAAVILCCVAGLLVVVLRITSPLALLFKLSATKTKDHQRHLAVPQQDAAEKTNLTFAPQY